MSIYSSFCLNEILVFDQIQDFGYLWYDFLHIYFITIYKANIAFCDLFMHLLIALKKAATKPHISTNTQSLLGQCRNVLQGRCQRC